MMRVSYKRGISILLIILMVLGGLNGLFIRVDKAYAEVAFAGGTGTIGDPYRVATAVQLNELRNHTGGGIYFRQTADIDLSIYTNWVPIGDLGDSFFGGNLDGNGFKITNLKINRSGTDNVGLFTAIAYGELKNINLVSINVVGKNNTGGLVGQNQGTISNSSATGTLRGVNNTGGLVGLNLMYIRTSYSKVNVTGGTGVGGLAGYSQEAISSTYATGTVSGTSQVGGLVGTNALTINKSYATGKITGSSAGGLIGSNTGTITNSFYDKTTTKQSDTGKGVGYVTASMKLLTTYTNAGWNFSVVWGMDSAVNSGYPFLDALPTSVIAGVAVPVAGAAPTASIAATSAYTAAIVWSPADATFAGNTAYTATITLTPKTGYTLAGITANYFTVVGANSTNAADSGVITVVFPATQAIIIATAAVVGVTAPVKGGTPVASIASTAQYTAAIAWSPEDATFAANTAYTATITLTPKAGYTLTGVPANYFTIAGVTATNSVNAGVITAVFPLTEALSSTATLTSTIGTVSTGVTANETIMDIPYLTTLTALRTAITPAVNATFDIYDADGTTLATAALATGQKLIVTAEDRITKITYTLTVNAPPDITPPVITLIGNATVNLTYGASYMDAGATALDNIDGDRTSHIVVTVSNDVYGGSVLNTAVAGTYTYHYNVNDTAGNAAVEVTRSVVVAIQDTTLPVITLIGNATVNLTYGASYTDAGATALDNIDGDRTNHIVVTVSNDVYGGSVLNTAVAGTYTFHYNVSDTAGNEAVEVTRSVVVAVQDITLPVITLIGNATVNLTYGASYTDAGATALDNIDGDRTSQIVVTVSNEVYGGSVLNTAVAGTYTYHYNVNDTAGNAAVEVTRSVVVAIQDTTLPVITLIGNATVNLTYGASYMDAGATALDNIDGDRTSHIVVTVSNDVYGGSVLNTAVAGTYTFHYNVSDTAGNEAVEVTRSVVVAVQDITLPVITLIGNATVNLTYGASYMDAGATALDNIDGDRTNHIVVTVSNDVYGGSVLNTAVAGTYTFHYNVSDTAGNEAVEVTRSVVVAVQDINLPVITLIGNATVNLIHGATYTDAGATALDNIDGDRTSHIVVTISNDVNAGSVLNTAVAGTYTYHYNVSDTAGNAAVEVTRSVVVAVKDITLPIITLVGNANVNLIHGATYTDAGATALDNIDGDRTSHIVVTISNDVNSGSVLNTAVAGKYTYHYNVSDTAGNAAVEVTRSVVVAVKDITLPIITLVGNANVNLIHGATYTDAGATALDNIDGDRTSHIVVTISNDVNSGSVLNTAVAGKYTYHYNVSDTAGNAAVEVTRNVVVATQDITLPIITLIGNATVNLTHGASYMDAGATALDNIDGDRTSHIVVTISNDVNAGSVLNTAVAGTYTYHYNVSDTAGNAAVEVTRSVVVATQDITLPIITLIGNATVNLTHGASYTDAGATALDNIDGDRTSHIVVTISNDVNSGSVLNTAVAGKYTFHYNVSDSAGNNAVEKTRTVVVTPYTQPTNVPTATPAPTATPSPISTPTVAPTPTATPKVDVFINTAVSTGNTVKSIETKVTEALKNDVPIVVPTDTKGHWAEKTIDVFLKLGILQGYGDKTIKPDADITRAEFATILSKVFDIAGGTSIPNMGDIGDHWAKDAIEKLTAAGVLSGYGDGTFRPDRTISREEMIVIISRIVNLSAVESVTDMDETFTDIGSSYAKDALIEASKAGLISGRGDNKLEPKAKSTRAEALQLILNALNLNPEVKTLLDSLG
ncbi:DUF5011 domain-containing protein [Paenibacillus psychroresistens]|uniref:DUF5011 domain-containing protein n=1 Tax=Paenibacillus psychroresistens TaxID=1778678 RepID=A0A6B8RVC5_9BACL|nr:immunoglobulin-like domain-containing protein [Paenibacillus psychroresistens]QGQ99822.1 DUF5011 domain-containing protein [Paenibacillus psychroresistens]